jgi:hypothetical protein
MNRAAHILVFIVFAFAIIAHVYVIFVMLNEQSETTYLPDHNQSAICGE